MKKYKHKKTGEIATYKDGVLKSSGFCVEIGVEPSSEFWEEIIEKEKSVLFTTEDGVDIFKNMNIWVVSKLFSVPFKALSSQISKSSNHRDGYYKYFSSKEKAEEYIILNKPCLSINDITTNLEAFKNNKYILNELKQLVKSKL